MLKDVTQKLNKHSNRLFFDPVEHTYTLDGVSLIPVTSMIGIYHEEFDKEERSKAYADRRKMSEWQRLQVLKEWEKNSEDACNLGHRVHDFAERYFYYRDALVPSDGFEKAVVNFWKDLPDNIVPVSAERKVYSERFNYAGTMDNLFYDTYLEGFIISDYKTNKDLYKNYNGNRLKEPFEFLLDMPVNKYQIQVSSYQIPLEELGLKVVGRWIIWLKNDGTYSLIKTEDCTQLIRNSLNY